MGKKLLKSGAVGILQYEVLALPPHWGTLTTTRSPILPIEGTATIGGVCLAHLRKVKVTELAAWK